MVIEERARSIDLTEYKQYIDAVYEICRIAFLYQISLLKKGQLKVDPLLPYIFSDNEKHKLFTLFEKIVHSVRGRVLNQPFQFTTRKSEVPNPLTFQFVFTHNTRGAVYYLQFVLHLNVLEPHPIIAGYHPLNGLIEINLHQPFISFIRHYKKQDITIQRDYIRDPLKYIRNGIEHEIIHYLQDRGNIHSKFGKIPGPSRFQSNDYPHTSIDVEFKPNVHTIANHIIDNSENTPSARRSSFREVFGLISPSKYFEYYHNLLQRTKQHDLKKFNRYAKEVYDILSTKNLI